MVRVMTLDFWLLIPCYNNIDGLIRSVASVVYGPKNYGILVVDDGSEQPVPVGALTSHLQTGAHLQLIRLPTNAGITVALNTGLAWLAQKRDHLFVARLDCGDICTPGRFMTQVGYLTDHPEIDLLGSWVQFKDFSSDFSYVYRTPVDERGIERGMHFRNLFIHPAVMWRASVHDKVKNYPSDLPHAEDYGFFYEILRKGKVAIIPEVLVTCEINPAGISIRYREEQLRSRIKTILRYRKSRLLGFLGAMKLQLMLFIPYKFILLIKSRNLNKLARLEIK